MVTSSGLWRIQAPSPQPCWSWCLEDMEEGLEHRKNVHIGPRKGKSPNFWRKVSGLGMLGMWGMCDYCFSLEIKLSAHEMTTFLLPPERWLLSVVPGTRIMSLSSIPSPPPPYCFRFHQMLRARVCAQNYLNVLYVTSSQVGRQPPQTPTLGNSLNTVSGREVETSQ